MSMSAVSQISCEKKFTKKWERFGKDEIFLESNRDKSRVLFLSGKIFILIELLTTSGKRWNFFSFLFNS